MAMSVSNMAYGKVMNFCAELDPNFRSRHDHTETFLASWCSNSRLFFRRIQGKYVKKTRPTEDYKKCVATLNFEKADFGKYMVNGKKNF